MKHLLPPLLLLLITGCSSQPFIDPISQQEGRSLEVPPDLTQPIDSGLLPIPDTIAQQQNNQKSDSTLLVTPNRITLMRLNGHHWLQIEGGREGLWRLLTRFWEEVGIPLRLENSQIGMMETLWFQGREHRYLSPTRDKVRLRIEAAAEGEAIELYLTHYGAIQQEEEWQQRDRDVDIELELYRRLASYLGQNIESATQSVQKSEHYRISADGLSIPERFDRAWRLAGIAMERIGLVIKDRDRHRGVYYISQNSLINALQERESSWFTAEERPATSTNKEKKETPSIEFQLQQGEDNSQLAITTSLPAGQRESILVKLQQQLLK